jgi:hypothetical protein
MYLGMGLQMRQLQTANDQLLWHDASGINIDVLTEDKFTWDFVVDFFQEWRG